MFGMILGIVVLGLNRGERINAVVQDVADVDKDIRVIFKDTAGWNKSDRAAALRAIAAKIDQLP